MWESILRVLSVAGRHNLRCLNHARVRVSSGSQHHSENRDLARIDTAKAHLFHPWRCREPP
jgi:hypothetical protein